MIIEYNCKFCRLKSAVEIDDTDHIMFQVDKWKPLLCCNRCADYMVAKRTLIDKVASASVLLSRSRLSETGATLLKVEAAIRERFTVLTKLFATLVCDYYRKQNVWEEAFVDMLMDCPDKFWQIVQQYAKGIRTI